jgi:tetratricopeptide (TPR) repeat protein
MPIQLPASPTIPSFNQTLQEALNHFRDPTWLGENSPLAAPFILGRQLGAKVESPRARGQVLQDVIKRAAEQLDGKYGIRSRTILEEYYFKGRGVRDVCAHPDVALAKSVFHTSQREAISSLATVLARELQPALALEGPPQLRGVLYGYNAIADACLAALRSVGTVGISGMGGTGKTTIGSHIAQAWGPTHTCWYTIRPGLNDHLGLLLRHLGYFFQQHGSPLLWQQLIATDRQAISQADLQTILGLLRYSLEQRRQPILLCIDEIDLLRPTEDGEHAQLMTFLRSVSGIMPLLLIGQRVAFDVDLHFELAGVTKLVMRQWLHAEGLHLASEEHDLLWSYTAGSPQLLSLFLTMQKVGEPLAAVLGQLPAAPSVEDLLGRIVSRLTPDERSVLFALAVILDVAPCDAWQHGTAAGALHMLAERRLVQSDEYGGIWLLPIFRQLLVRIMAPEQLSALHSNAARIYAERGKYTTAAYHLVAAGEPRAALLLWREYREQQIDQGQGHAALQIFRPLLQLPWEAQAAEELRLICARLEQLLGRGQLALQDLRSIVWQMPLLRIEADELAGEIANDLSRFSDASSAFDEGLQTAEHLLEVRLARMHKGRAWTYLRTVGRDQAWLEVQRAAYEVENFKGLLQEEQYCNYVLAERHYRSALDLAQELDHVQGLAKTHANLSGLYARLGHFSQALEHWHAAETSYQHLGKTLAIAGCKLNLAFLYILAGEYQLALQASGQVESFLTTRGVTMPSGMRNVLDQGMAETYLGLNDLPAAERCALAALHSSEKRTLPDTHRTLAEIALAQNDLVTAKTHIQEALALARAYEDRYLEAYAWRVAVRIAAACHDEQGARSAATAAVTLFTQLGLAHEASKVLPL